MSRLRIAALLVAAATLSGCWLVDADVANLRLETSEKEFTIDTADWGLSSDQTLPAVPCQQTNDLCMQASSMYCSPGDAAECSAICTAAATCRLSIDVALHNTIELSNENAFQEVNDQPLTRVTIESVEYRVLENTLNVASPVLNLSIGPVGVMSPSGEGVQHLGSVASIEAGTQPESTVELTDEGRTHLREFIEGEGYKSPFNIIVSTRLDLEANDTMPAGRARVAVKIIASARLGL